MRTTLTLDPDVAALLERATAERGVSFKAVVNEAIRAGLGQTQAVEYHFVPKALGGVLVDLDHANRLAADLEDEAIVNKLAEGR